MGQYGNRAACNFNFIRWDDPNVSTTNQSKTLPFDPAAGFHLYALEWDLRSIKYYVDNTLIRTVNQSPDYPAVFLLGLYENAGWTGSADITASRYPREFYVDYFRAYAKGTSVTPAPIKALYLSNNSSSHVELFDIKGCNLSVYQNSRNSCRYLMNRNLPKGLYLIRKGGNKMGVELLINP